MPNKYGYDKTDPDYWIKTTRAIFDDPALTREDKLEEVTKLVQEYQAEKRDKTAREKAKAGYRGNLDTNNPEIKKAEDYAKSIQNPNFKKKA